MRFYPGKGEVIEESYVSTFFKPYPPEVHKGDFGRVFIIAGSVGMTGAAALSGHSALRSGAGLVTVGIPESLNDILEIKLTEAMTLPLPEGPKRSIGKRALEPALEFASKCDVIVLGPGLSMEEETQDFVRSFVASCNKPLVLDADGLNALALALAPEVLKNAPGPKIITPHPREMARLLSTTPETIQQDRTKAVKAAAKKYKCIAILKGAKTLVYDGDSLWINLTGNPGMATGGSGDVLSGVIAGFLARGMKPHEAALAGVYIHGQAGDLAAAEKGEISLIAGDIIEFLPQAIKNASNPVKSGGDMKTLIVYATKHGTTEKCARLLAKKLDGDVDLCNLKKDPFPDPNPYDKVIIGGPVYIGKALNEVKNFCNTHLETLRTKKIGLYICGMQEGEIARKEIDSSYPDKLLRVAVAKECFGGEFIFGKMNFMERFIVKKVAKIDKNISAILDENIERFALSLNKA